LAVRPLTSFEAPIAKAVVDLGNLKSWEFAAFLESANGPLIEFITRMRADGADPSSDVTSRVAPVVVHHNHLSQESLSIADWHGLTVFVSETFAHCADGSIYWGKVNDVAGVQRVRVKIQSVEMDAASIVSDILLDQGVLNSADYGTFFRKEVINRAMKLAGFVEYEFAWGSDSVSPPHLHGGMPAPGPAGITGAQICSLIDAAAQKIATNL